MDPFLRETPLELQSVYYPLGFPLHLKTNCEAVRTAAEESWGGRAQAFDPPPLELQVIVQPGGGRPPNPVYRAQAHLMSIVSDAENFATCDYTNHFAFCRLNSAAASDRPFTAYYFLEALVYYSLTQLSVTPIHAACIARGGRGLLLCGPSGSGKTSLAYFCATKGWTYISDNESWLLRSAGTQILGNPRRIRFREDAPRLFPELQGKHAALHANGKLSIELGPADVSGIPTADCCAVSRIVFLSRETNGPVTVQLVPPSEVLRRLLSDVPIFEKWVQQEHEGSLRRIADLDAVELRYSRLDDAWQQLEAMLS